MDRNDGVRSILAAYQDAIRAADLSDPVGFDGDHVLTGKSGHKLFGVLQRFGQLWEGKDDACYLEVGVFQGLTLLSVAGAAPRLRSFGIDNFAFFDPNGKNSNIVESRMQDIGVENATIINMDYEDALETFESYCGERKIGVYFVDGPHDYRSQLICLSLALPHLHEQSIIVVDDSNYNHVRQANADFLRTNADWKLLFQAYTPEHPSAMTEGQREEARRGWWNGVNVLVRDPSDQLERVYPPTLRSRERFENDHTVHASRISELAPTALRAADSMLRWNPLSFLRQRVLLEREYRARKRIIRERHRGINTESSALTSGDLTPLRKGVAP